MSLSWLQRWYLSQCDGDWEHSEGIVIRTLDNPGWRVSISIKGSDLEGMSITPVVLERTENDWIRIWLGEESIECATGPLNLNEAFERIAELMSKSETHGGSK